MVQAGSLKLPVKEYRADKEFVEALEDARTHGRIHAVVLRFDGIVDAQATSKAGTAAAAPAITSASLPGKLDMNSRIATAAADPSVPPRPARVNWDVDLLDWGAQGEEAEAEERTRDSRFEKRVKNEENLFRHDAMLEELRIQRFTDDV